ncbi:MAG: polyprenyl synthetase family protein [Acidobacteriota bacterium]
MSINEGVQGRPGTATVRPRAYEEALRTEIRLTPTDMLALVAEPLAEVEKEFQRNLDSNIRVIAEIGRYISEGGGKRIRPGLLLLACRACGYQGRQDILYGAVFEFIHTATLVHDDVIDEADSRRGRQSVNNRWGNTLTILLGDYLYIRSLSMALSGGNLRILDLMSRITLQMIEGELIQTHAAGRLDLTETEYLDLVTRKTASLFSGCCETAGLLVGRDDWRECLRIYGLAIGIAYQLVDDLLDFTSEQAILGKPVASDLREGKLTLPVIDLISRKPGIEPMVRAIVDQPDDSDAAYATLVAGLQEEGCLERAHARALQEAEKAREALRPLPPTAFRDALLSLPDLLVSRKF